MNNISISGYTIPLAIFSISISIIFYFLNYIKKKNYDIARLSYYFSFFLITLSFIFLAYHFFTRDFRLSYVTAYSSSDLSFLYTISAIWAGQEGSFLLWVFLSLFLGLFLIKNLNEYENLGMFIYNLQIFALLFLLLKQSPFTLLQNIPLDGNGLNPLLLNPWMAIHPPFMFLGYSAFAIPFTFALLLAIKKSFKDFYERTYKWVIFSWVTMAIGIILGGFWAYETLGWGGFWGWDPVENASLIPWLIMTALIHSLILQKKYKTFFKINFLLSIFSFIFVLYGTFLTRSGVLQDFSVHSFIELGITGILLFILFFFLLLSLIIFFFTIKNFPKSEPIDSFFSKKSFIIYGIIVLLFLAFFVTLGTSSPIITKIYSQPSKVSNNFYINTSIPLVILLLLFFGIYPLFKNFRKYYLIISLIAGILFSTIFIIWGIKNALHILIIFLSIFSIFMQYFNYKFKNVFFLHSGIILFIFGSLFSTGYDEQKKLKLFQGEIVEYKNYSFIFKDFIFPENGKSYLELELQKKGKKFIAKPKLWFNEKTQQIVSNPDIKIYLFSDLYISAEQFNPKKDEIISFKKNEEKEVGKIKLLFKGFQINGEHSMGGGFEVISVFEMKKDGEIKEILPKFTLAQNGMQKNELLLDDENNIKISIDKLDASSGTVFLKIINEQNKPYVIISVMFVPLISLVWLSSILVILFGTIVFFKRLKS